MSISSTAGMLAPASLGALLTEGMLSAMAQASHTDYRQALFDVQRTKGTRAYLEMQDGPFQPEPMGPRSKPRKPRGSV
jgi:hypothetical protein